MVMMDASHVDEHALSQLLAHDLPRYACKEALKRFNNHADEALDFLLDTDEGLELCTHFESPDQASQPEGDSSMTFFYERLLDAAKQQDGVLADSVLQAMSSISDDDETLGHLLRPASDNGELLLHLCQTASPLGMVAKAITWLLAAKADPNVQNVLRESPLALAVRTASGQEWEGGFDAIQELLDARANPNSSDGQGETPLMEAVCMGNTSLCQVLLRAGADMNHTSISGMTPRRFASEHPDVAAIFDKLEQQQQLGQKIPLNEESSRSPPMTEATLETEELLTAVKSHDVRRVRSSLLNIKATTSDRLHSILDFQDNEGNALIHHVLHEPEGDANWQSVAQCVDLLLGHRADPNLQNNYGETPAMCATRAAGAHGETHVHNGFAVVLRALFSGGADPNICEGVSGETPLIEAACIGSLALCRELLNAGADVDFKSPSGLKASDFAAGNPEMLELFATSRNSAAGMSTAAVSPEVTPEHEPSAAEPTPSAAQVDSAEAGRYEVPIDHDLASSSAEVPIEHDLASSSAAPETRRDPPVYSNMADFMDECEASDEEFGLPSTTLPARQREADSSSDPLDIPLDDSLGDPLVREASECDMSASPEMAGNTFEDHLDVPLDDSFDGDACDNDAGGSSMSSKPAEASTGADDHLGTTLDGEFDDPLDCEGASSSSTSKPGVVGTAFDDPLEVPLDDSSGDACDNDAGGSGVSSRTVEVGPAFEDPPDVPLDMPGTFSTMSASKSTGADPPGTDSSEDLFDDAAVAACSSATPDTAAEENVQATSGNPEVPAISMSELLAKARSSPEAKRANLPQKKSLGTLEKHSEVCALLDAVEAHSVTLVSERMSAVKHALRVGWVEFLSDARDLDGYSVIHRCILAPPIQNNWDDVVVTVEALLLQGVSANAANLKGETPLLFAVRERGAQTFDDWVKLLDVLLQHGADPNLADAAHVTPLMHAIMARDSQLIQFLLDHGGDAFLCSGPRCRTAFEELRASFPTAAARLAVRHGVRDDNSAEVNGAVDQPSLRQSHQTQDVIRSRLLSAVQGHNITAVRQACSSWKVAHGPLGSLISQTDGDGHGWLHLCLLAPPRFLCWAGAVDVLTELIDAKAQVNHGNSRGETPLLHAAREVAGVGEARIELIRVLVDALADVNLASHSGRTPLMEAAVHADVNLCGILLRSKADAGKVDSKGVTAAQIAASAPPVASLFLDLAGVDCCEHRRGKLDEQMRGRKPDTIISELRHEAMRHSTARVEQLLQTSSKAPRCLDYVSQVDDGGHALLHLCILGPPSDADRLAQAGTLDLLLRKTANPNQKNLLGESPLLMLVRETAGSSDGGRMLVISQLLKADADLESSDMQGMTPLMEAARQNDVQIVEVLLECGARFDRTNKAGLTAFDLAPRRGKSRELLGQQVKTGFWNKAKDSKGTNTSSSHQIMQAVQSHDFRALSDHIIALKEREVADVRKRMEQRGGNASKDDCKKISAILGTQDADGHSLLHLCIFAPPISGMDRSALVETVKVLLTAKADVDMRNALGETPLLLAVRETAGTGDEARLALLRVLLKAGAEWDLPDNQDTTPLMEAAMLGDVDMCRVLLDRGANMHRRGPQGLSAREIAAQNPSVRAIFDAQAESMPAEESKPLVSVTLRHLSTNLERVVEIAGDASMVDVKKLIVRLSKGGSWRRVAILTESSQILHDTEHLNGRRLLIMADAKSIAAQKAAEEALPEEERWKRYSVEELRAEVASRGVYCGEERDEVLKNLLEVKRWESLSSKDLRSECSNRGLLVDLCPDRDDLLAQLKQDFSWENMREEALQKECKTRGVPPPTHEDPKQCACMIRSRLRQVQRWELLPLDQLRKSCELRNYKPPKETDRSDLLKFLKTFKTLPRAAPTPPEASAKAKAKCNPRAREPAPPDSSNRSPSHDERTDTMSARLSRLLNKYPDFDGPIPDDIEDWLDADIELYLYSNGFLKPNRQKKKASGSKVPRRIHYQTLGLPDGAPEADVKKTYKRLALKWHPDKNLEDPEAAAQQFRVFTEAYEALTSPEAPAA